MARGAWRRCVGGMHRVISCGGAPPRQARRCTPRPGSRGKARGLAGKAGKESGKRMACRLPSYSLLCVQCRLPVLQVLQKKGAPAAQPRSLCCRRPPGAVAAAQALRCQLATMLRGAGGALGCDCTSKSPPSTKWHPSIHQPWHTWDWWCAEAFFFMLNFGAVLLRNHPPPARPQSRAAASAAPQQRSHPCPLPQAWQTRQASQNHVTSCHTHTQGQPHKSTSTQLDSQAVLLSGLISRTGEAVASPTQAPITQPCGGRTHDWV